MDGDLFDQDRTIDIPVKAGWKAGTKLTYPGEGDEERDDHFYQTFFVENNCKHVSFLVLVKHRK